MGLRLLSLLAVAVAAMALLASTPAPVSGQVVGAGVMSCTASLITSFAPCLNFIINNTASPTADCCRSLGTLMTTSTGCACQILTGSVPGVPVNRSMAVTLPRACNNASVPLKCQDATTAALTPAPSPVADAPAPGPFADAPAPSMMAPLPPVTPAAATPEPEAEAPVEPTATPPVSQGQTRPTVVPSTTSGASALVSAGPAAALLLAVAGAALQVSDVINRLAVVG
ncbi:unnamed protein product [Urochloa decumbens]|uniref:Bifunctional inhibitor/plant lipid transfer protein/seed storage helical domain-containing protein n=1 Tax=Urochloa decumbens TaxID=240449 RepID=A0ABC9F0G2_9POAL